MIPCLIDDSVITAILSYPIARGWVSLAGPYELLPNITAEMVAERQACALVGSVDAALLADRFAVITDVALVSHHSSAVALWTAERPDAVERVPIALDGVSRTAEAIARATIPHFYGIQPTAWQRPSAEGEAVVREGVAAFQPVEAGYLSDLGRAWFILTNFPFPTHLLVAPKAIAQQDRASLESVVRDLQSALEVGDERRREIRRNLSDDYGLDRERFTEFTSDQTTTLTRSGRKAWRDLLNRVGRAMKLPLEAEPEFVSILAGEEQSSA
ncbi:MAG: hypothetical protein IRY97_00280 [Thermomicrobiaceae bacterium]|nr:hypothetical protein [Thermomicrobiaceae bacterium]